MIRFNRRMQILMEPLTCNVSAQYPSTRRMIEAGFVAVEGCYFLRTLFRQRYLEERQSSPAARDDTGPETFVNKMHVEDFKERPVESVAFAIQYQMLSNWAASEPELVMRSAYSINDGAHALRFYVERGGEIPYLIDDLELYAEEAVIEVSSTSVDELKRLLS